MGISSIKQNESNNTLQSIQMDVNIDEGLCVCKDMLEIYNERYKPLEKNRSQSDNDFFVSLLNREIQIFNSICENIRLSDKKNLNLLSKYSNCIRRSILFHYNCKMSQVTNILKKLHYSDKCSSKINNQNYEYLDCDGVAFRFVDNKLVNYYFGLNKKESQLKFKWSILKLCDDDEYYENALCSAYELRDEFKNDLGPIKVLGNYSRCSNKIFDLRLEQLNINIDAKNQNLEDKLLKRSGRSAKSDSEVVTNDSWRLKANLTMFSISFLMILFGLGMKSKRITCYFVMGILIMTVILNY